MFKVPEKQRITFGPMGSDKSYGCNGAFEIRLSGTTTAYVIASDGEGWEHVSVHVARNGTIATPTWAEMCKVKNLFWDADDCVVQYHPPENEYINNHPYTLHLWRQIGAEYPLPPQILVGLKELNPQQP